MTCETSFHLDQIKTLTSYLWLVSYHIVRGKGESDIVVD